MQDKLARFVEMVGPVQEDILPPNGGLLEHPHDSPGTTRNWEYVSPVLRSIAARYSVACPAARPRIRDACLFFGLVAEAANWAELVSIERRFRELGFDVLLRHHEPELCVSLADRVVLREALSGTPVKHARVYIPVEPTFFDAQPPPRRGVRRLVLSSDGTLALAPRGSL